MINIPKDLSDIEVGIYKSGYSYCESLVKVKHIFVLYQIQDTDTLHRKKPCLPLHIKTPICLSLMAKAWVHIVFAMKMYALRFSIKTSITMLNLLSIFLASALDRKIRLQNRCLIVSEI